LLSLLERDLNTSLEGLGMAPPGRFPYMRDLMVSDMKGTGLVHCCTYSYMYSSLFQALFVVGCKQPL